MARFEFWETPDELVQPILALKAELAALNVQRAARRLALTAKYNFNPGQPRVPAGDPEGGRWTDAGDGSGLVRVAVNDRGRGAIVSDAGGGSIVNDWRDAAADAISSTNDKTFYLPTAERAAARRKLILLGEGGSFYVADNPGASSQKPWIR